MKSINNYQILIFKDNEKEVKLLKEARQNV